MPKLSLKEIVAREAPQAGEGLIRLLKNKNSAKALMWLVDQFESSPIIYAEDLAQYLQCSYQNTWNILRNFERSGLLYRSKGAFHPTKTPNGDFILKKYLKYALKTRGY